MNDSSNSFATDVQALAAETRHGFESHPSVDDLVAYQEGAEFDETVREMLRDHLALCHKCTRLLLDRERFAELGDGDLLSAVQIAADKRAVLARLSEAPPADDAQVLPFRTPAAPALAAPPQRRRWYRPVAVAAGLLATVGLGGWITTLQLRIAGLSEPRVDVAVHTLLGIDSAPMRGPEEDLLPASVATNGVLLLLASGKAAGGPTYHLELGTASGRSLWSHPDLPRDPQGRFTLEIPGGFLSPGGEYRLRIYSPADEREVPFEEYAFRLATQ